MLRSSAGSGAERPLVFLLRHGQIRTDGKKRFIGVTDPPLDTLGEDQAKAWQTEFKPIRFHGVFTSALTRCKKTAALACPGLAARTDSRLNEINMGEWDGQSFDVIRQAFPDAFAARGKNMAGFRPPGGESFEDVLKRALPFFNALDASCPGPVLVVSHSGVIRTLLTHWSGRGLERIFDISMGYAQLFVLAPAQKNAVKYPR